MAAAGALHNFLRIHDRLNAFDVEIDDEDDYDPDDHTFLAGAAIPERRVLAITPEESQRANERRHRIMMSMWNAYIVEFDDRN